MIGRLSALAVLCLPATAGAYDYRVLGEAHASDDTDHQSQQWFYAGYQRALPQVAADSSGAAWLGWRHLESDDGSESFKALRLDFEAPTTERTRVKLRLNPLIGSDWSPVLGGVSAIWKPDATWYFEAFADRELVDTVRAVRDENHVDTYGLSGDYRFWGLLTLIVSAFGQSFDDGNERLGRVFRLDYASEAWAGFGAQLRAKRVDADAPGVGYFSPRRLEEAELRLRYVVPLADQRWQLALRASGGRQRIDGNGSENLYGAEIGLRGWFTDHYGLEAQAQCSNTGGLAGDAADDGYRYCAATLSFIGSW